MEQKIAKNGLSYQEIQNMVFSKRVFHILYSIFLI